MVVKGFLHLVTYMRTLLLFVQAANITTSMSIVKTSNTNITGNTQDTTDEQKYHNNNKEDLGINYEECSTSDNYQHNNTTVSQEDTIKSFNCDNMYNNNPPSSPPLNTSTTACLLSPPKLIFPTLDHNHSSVTASKS